MGYETQRSQQKGFGFRNRSGFSRSAVSSQREEQISHAVKRHILIRKKKNRNSNKVVRRTHSLILNEKKKSAAAMKDVEIVSIFIANSIHVSNIGPPSPLSQQV